MSGSASFASARFLTRHAILSKWLSSVCTIIIIQMHDNQAQVDAQIAHEAKFLQQLYLRPDIIFTHGNGTKLYDTLGREYIDFNAGIAVNALGHNDAGLAEIIADQATKLIHLSNLYHNIHTGAYAQAIVESLTCGREGCGGAASCTNSACNAVHNNASAQSTPAQRDLGKGRLADAKVFFCNSGTEANEGAFKFARKYARATSDRPSKYNIVSFSNAFHGRTLGALSATPNKKYQTPFMPLIPGFLNGTFNDIQSIHDLVNDDTCAVIVEPIQGEGGVHVASEQFLTQLRQACNRVGALLIFDEIQCGVGRTGTLFAYEQTGIVPDMITMAKPLANGVPVGAVVLGSHVSNLIVPGDHGTTFGGSPMAARLGLYTWQKISQPAFLANVRRVGAHLIEKCNALQTKYPHIVKHVRGRGLIAGMQLADSYDTAQFVDLCRHHGVLVISAGLNTIRLIPALTIDTPEIETVVQVFDK
eukprot:jgi/Hompol1/5281/HPOL_004304-RA